MTGVELIAAERQRQVAEEEFDADHDSYHVDGELAIVAAIYAAAGDKEVKVLRFNVETEVSHLPVIADAWPERWDPDYDKRGNYDPIRRLTIAGALIAAEIDRLQATKIG